MSSSTRITLLALHVIQSVATLMTFNFITFPSFGKKTEDEKGEILLFVAQLMFDVYSKSM